MGIHMSANKPVNADATESVPVSLVKEAPATVFVTVRLRLAVGAYSKTGGKARFHVHADGSFEYENSRGERSPINGIQAERQYGKLGFNVKNGFNDPLVRATRAPIVKAESAPMTDAERERLLELAKG
jgi:hypothetical protein